MLILSDPFFFWMKGLCSTGQSADLHGNATQSKCIIFCQISLKTMGKNCFGDIRKEHGIMGVGVIAIITVDAFNFSPFSLNKELVIQCTGLLLPTTHGQGD